MYNHYFFKDRDNLFNSRFAYEVDNKISGDRQQFYGKYFQNISAMSVTSVTFITYLNYF